MEAAYAKPAFCVWLLPVLCGNVRPASLTFSMKWNVRDASGVFGGVFSFPKMDSHALLITKTLLQSHFIFQAQLTVNWALLKSSQDLLCVRVHLFDWLLGFVCVIPASLPPFPPPLITPSWRLNSGWAGTTSLSPLLPFSQCCTQTAQNKGKGKQRQVSMVQYDTSNSLCWIYLELSLSL